MMYERQCFNMVRLLDWAIPGIRHTPPKEDMRIRKLLTIFFHREFPPKL